MPDLDLVDVTAADDPRLADYRELTDVALRRRLEPELGLFVAEGELVIRRALAAGYAPRSLLMSPRWLDGLADTIPAGTTVYRGPEPLLTEITGFHVHRGALASMARRPLAPLADLLARCRRLVVLEDVNTHTNVGAIFRAAAALGTDGVLLSPQCADPLYRRSVRVSMGSVFAVPYARATAWPADLAAVVDAGFALWALTPDPAAVSLAHVVPAPRTALLFGAEGPGLSPAATALARPVRIPMAAGVDSLNVAAAAAVACWALRPTP